MSAPVVISGVGTVGAYGAGVDALRSALVDGHPTPVEIERAERLHRERGARLAHMVDPAILADWLPRGAARRLSPPSKFAVAAARMAVREAGLDEAEVGGDRTSVAIGIGHGTSYASRMLDQMAELGPLGVAPMLFIESVSNAPAGQVAVTLGARGPNATVTQHQASGLLAVLAGVEHVRSGRADVAVVGVVDENSGVAHAALDRFGALARAADTESGVESTRPFAKDRSGFVAAEGATVLVVESEERVAARGGRVVARVLGGVRANDPTASSTSWGTDAAGLAGSLRRGLARHGIDPASLQRLVSGASGSRPGDALEAAVIGSVWPDPAARPTVVAPKGAVGEYGGGFLAAALLATEAHPRFAAPTAPADPALGLDLGGADALPAAKRSLVSTLAAGGSSVWKIGRAHV